MLFHALTGAGEFYLFMAAEKKNVIFFDFVLRSL